LLGIGLYEIWSDFETLGCELAFFYIDRGGTRNFWRGFGFRGEGQSVRLGLKFEVYAEEGSPEVGRFFGRLRLLPKGNLAVVPSCFDFEDWFGGAAEIQE
jgi:hypothetical protein